VGGTQAKIDEYFEALYRRLPVSISKLFGGSGSHLLLPVGSFLSSKFGYAQALIVIDNAIQTKLSCLTRIVGPQRSSAE
jgi:hypothetical protein